LESSCSLLCYFPLVVSLVPPLWHGGLGKGLLSNIWNSFFGRTTYDFWGMGAAHPPLLLAIAIARRRIVKGVGVVVPASMACDGKDGSWNLNFVQVEQTREF